MYCAQWSLVTDRCVTIDKPDLLFVVYFDKQTYACVSIWGPSICMVKNNAKHSKILESKLFLGPVYSFVGTTL